MIAYETAGSVEALFDEVIGVATSEVSLSHELDARLLAKFNLTAQELIEAGLQEQSLDTVRLVAKHRMLTNAHAYFHNMLDIEDASIKEQVERQKGFLENKQEMLESFKSLGDAHAEARLAGDISGHREVISILAYFI